MIKMIILRPKKVIFERFWLFSKYHFPACSTLVITTFQFELRIDWGCLILRISNRYVSIPGYGALRLSEGVNPIIYIMGSRVLRCSFMELLGIKNEDSNNSTKISPRNTPPDLTQPEPPTIRRKSLP